MKNKLVDKIYHFRNGRDEELESIFEKMKPLLINRAIRLNVLEFDDAYQELSIALLEAIKNMKYFNNENQILKYFTVSIDNRWTF